MKALQKLSLLFVSVVIALALAEATTRLARPQPPSWLDVYRRHPTLPFHALRPNARARVVTGETRWSVITDAEGFRVSEDRSRTYSGRSALVLGDSFTFGHGVDYEETFVNLLEQSLPGGYRFTNAGVGGYGPVQYRRVFEYLLARGHDPDLLLVAIYLGNDLLDCIWSKDVPVVDGIIGARGDLRSWVKRNSHLYRLLAVLYHKFSPEQRRGPRETDSLYVENEWATGELRRAREAFRSEFESIERIAHQRGIPILVALIPTRVSVEALISEGEKDAGVASPHLPARKVTAVLDEIGVPYVDLAPPLASEATSTTYFAFDGHFTPAGHRIAAEAIRQGILAAP